MRNTRHLVWLVGVAGTSALDHSRKTRAVIIMWSVSFFLIIVLGTLQVRGSFFRRAPRECWENSALRDLLDPPHPPSFDLSGLLNNPCHHEQYVPPDFPALNITRMDIKDQHIVAKGVKISTDQFFPQQKLAPKKRSFSRAFPRN